MAAPSQLAAFLRPTLWAVVATSVALVAWRVGGGSLPGLRDQVSATATIEDLTARGAGQLQQPDPDLSPADVVRVQLAGLADARGDGLGVLQCFLFASPRNRLATGPLDWFAEMVRTEPFARLARPRAVLVGEPQIDGRFAKLLVTTIGRDDQLHAFAFILYRQDAAPFADCWMTEAVYPVGEMAPPAERGGITPDAA
jgi:hypothetical protein